MAMPISLRDVVNGIDGLPAEATSYLNTKTGEVYTVLEGELESAEEEMDDAEEEGLSKEEAADRAKVRGIVQSEDWIEMPTMHDFHEYAVMESFCQGLENERLRVDLLDLIRGSGAFKRFKNKVQREGIEERWYAYRDQALTTFARDWLEEKELTFRD